MAAKTEDERQQACMVARDKVKAKTNRFGEVAKIFDEAELLIADEELKEEAKLKSLSCPDLASQLLDILDGRLRDICNAAQEQALTDEDLLAIYHAFSLQVETLLDGKDAKDPGIDRTRGAVRTRLDAVRDQLSDALGKEKALRKALHAALDTELDKQGMP